MEKANKEDFSKLRKQIDEAEQQREGLIRDSRDILTLSKQMIFQVHRKDMNAASESRKALESSYKAFVAKYDNQDSGSYRVAVQEYVEAAALYSFVKEGKLPTSDELHANVEGYLLGVCDLSGELVRLAVNSAIREEYSTVKKVREFLGSLYEQLLGLSLRRGDLRKKFDSVKWDLNRIDELVLNLKMRDSI